MRVRALDGLRGILACAVAFFWHYQFIAEEIPFHGMFKIIYDNSWMAVEIFFAISGFGMYLSYKKKIEQNEIGILEYIKRRFKYIYPLHIITLVIVTVEQILYLQKMGSTFIWSGFDVKHFLLNMMLLQSGWLDATISFNGPAWCLSVNMFLYIWFFYVIKWSGKSRERRYLAYGMGYIVGLVCIAEGGLYPIFNVFMGRGLCCFIEGALVGEILIENNRKISGISGKALVILGTWFLCYGLFESGEEFWGEKYGFLIYFIVIVVPAVLVLSINNRFIKGLLETRPFQFLGKISMSIYLWHFPILLFLKLLETYRNISFYKLKGFWFVYIAMVLIISWLFSVFYDKFMKMKHYLPVWKKGEGMNDLPGNKARNE